MEMGILELLETGQAPVVACGSELRLVRAHEALRLARICAPGATGLEMEELAEALAQLVAAGRAARA